MQKITTDKINKLILEGVKEGTVNADLISDTFHNFGELYEHRITLFIALAKSSHATWLRSDKALPAWRTIAHSDGEVWDGWFILGLGTDAGEQITYHLPMSKWDECEFANTLYKAPDWDGHTSDDVLVRIAKLFD